MKVGGVIVKKVTSSTETSMDITSDGWCKSNLDPDFSSRWDAHFGEPTTEVFTLEEFEDWFREVMEFA